MSPDYIAVDRSHRYVEVPVRIGRHRRRGSDLTAQLVQEKRPILYLFRVFRTVAEREVRDVIRYLFCRTVHVGGLYRGHERVERNADPDACKSVDKKRKLYNIRPS